MSLSFGSSTKKTNSSQETDPWDVTIPSLTNLVNQIQGQQSNVGATPTQNDAFAQLFQNASAGNPYQGQISSLATDTLNGPGSNAAQVQQGNTALQNQLGGYANGDNLDPSQNPYTAQALQLNANDIQNRINSMFAGAGRDLSGKNQESLARGISEGTVPALFNQYNQNVANQFSAANALNSANSNAATTAQGLDTSALLARLQGIPASQAAIDAQNYGPNTQLALAQQQKQLPLQDLGSLEALLGPLAQLGSQQTGQSSTKGTSMGLGISNLFGGLGTLLSSDERVKDNKEKVGELADGTPIHKFTYKNDPNQAMHIGVMAQDVEKNTPEAVANVGGVKMVDYDMATKKSAAKLKKSKKGY